MTDTQSTWHAPPWAAAGGAVAAQRRGLWVGGGSSGASSSSSGRSGTLLTGLVAELRAVPPHWSALTAGEMGHGDLMSQAEDVADQVSSPPRETSTLSRPHTGLGLRQTADIFRFSRIPSTNLFLMELWTRHILYINQYSVIVNSAYGLWIQTAPCSGKELWSYVNFSSRLGCVVWWRQTVGVTWKSVVQENFGWNTESGSWVILVVSRSEECLLLMSHQPSVICCQLRLTADQQGNFKITDF